MTVFINKGDAYLTPTQAIARGKDRFDAEKSQYVRETGLLTASQDYIEWANQWLNDNTVNSTNNAFNYYLAAYRKAVTRLALYVLSEGRKAVTEMDENDELVVLLKGVMPLPALVDSVEYDEEGNSSTVQVANPLIVKDEAERAEAQVVVNATSAAVVSFAAK